MSRFLTITSSGSANFGERKKTVNAQTLKVGNITLNFLLAILICMLGVSYIFEVNSIATKGYEIKKMETQIGELKRQNENLKIQAAELKSMYSIEEKTKNLNMVAPKDVSFLSLPGDVAMK